jgi:hypothetical protein
MYRAAIAAKTNIPHYSTNLQDIGTTPLFLCQFKKKSAYADGGPRSPNPTEVISEVSEP